MLYARQTTRGAQKFPDAASVELTFSSSRSATALRNRAFPCFELLQPLNLIELQPAVFPPSAIVSRLRYPGRPAASATGLSCTAGTSTCRSLAMICSGVLRFPAMAVPLVVAPASHSCRTTSMEAGPVELGRRQGTGGMLGAWIACPSGNSASRTAVACCEGEKRSSASCAARSAIVA